MSGLCKDCGNPLIFEADDDRGGVESMPDDLQLPCGCHYHWQCLMEQAPAIAKSVSCPSCGKGLGSAGSSSGGNSILARYTNEGGVQENLDILPSITDEAFLASHPEAVAARAYHFMVREGDVSGVLDVMRVAQRHQDGEDDEDEDEEDDPEPMLPLADLVNWQDPMGGMKSGLHIAVEAGQEEVVWLLLWAASTLGENMFPEEVRQSAADIGLAQGTASKSGSDIRALKDSQGKTAEEVLAAAAAEVGGGSNTWHSMLQSGVLKPGA